MDKKQNVELMVLTALMTALAAVMTIVIAVPVPFTNGYIHFGDSVIFLAVIILGWKYAPIAAGLGSALADLFLGYAFWAPWTLVIKGVMALIAGLIFEKSRDIRRNQLLVCIMLVVLWVMFNVAVHAVVGFAAARDPAGLQSAVETGASDFGALMISIERQLMLFALLIPAGLIGSGLILRNKERISVPFYRILGLCGGGLFMVFGYFIAGGLITGNFAVAAFSIPSNIIQFIAGFLIAVILESALSKTPAHKYFQRLNQGRNGV